MDLTGCENIDDVRLGDRVLRWLDDRQISQSRVGREVGKSPTTIKRWLDGLNDGTIEEQQWAEFAEGLRRVGYPNPESLRPVTVATERALPVELLPLLDNFHSRAQLEALLQIIDARDPARGVLRVALSERLKHLK